MYRVFMPNRTSIILGALAVAVGLIGAAVNLGSFTMSPLLGV